MSLIVAGTVRVGVAKLDEARPHMLEMVASSRAEDGCIEYAYPRDIADPDLIRVFEIWRDAAALGAHFRTAHVARWRAATATLGIDAASERKITLFEISAERPV
ncbi:MAG: putative quinol monooxygenase [Caulobacteraceae bacterium]